MVSFEEGSLLLEELAGLRVDASQVKRGGESLGEEIAADEQRYTEPLAEMPLAPTLYMGLDGTGIPMRAVELAGRAGKQPHGSAETSEVKLCVIWSAEGRDSEGLPGRDPGSVTYSAAIESAASPGGVERSAFAERVLREAARRSFCDAPRSAIIGDGAPWIWNMDMEYRARIVPRRHPDRRPIPRQRNSPPNGAVDLRNRQRAEPDMGCSALRGTGRRQIARHCACSATVRRVMPRRIQMPDLHRPQSQSNALSTIPDARTLYFIRRRRSRMQSHYRHPPQTPRHALDTQGRQRHHRPPLLPSQW